MDEVPTLTATVGASYTYNGDGLEASRTSSGVLTQFTWGEMAGSSLPVIVSDGANDYVYGPSGEPVEQVSLATSAPTYLTYTPSDSSWLSTNEAGDETGFWRYDAFGTLAFGTPTSPFGYSGQYTDASTGFVNDRARWYQAQTGEFTTRDPDYSSTDTAYAYAGDDPIDKGDPTGDLAEPCWQVMGTASDQPQLSVAKTSASQLLAGPVALPSLSTPDVLCQLESGPLSSDGIHVLGGASLSCVGTVHYMTLYIVIQQYRAFGFWRTKNTGPEEKVDGPGEVYAHAAWTCAPGTGNQKYRAVAHAYVIDILGYSVSGETGSPSAKFTCPEPEGP